MPSPLRLSECSEGGTETWPSLRITVEFAPWHWRVGLYRDAIERAGQLDLGPLAIEWFANTPAFDRT